MLRPILRANAQRWAWRTCNVGLVLLQVDGVTDDGHERRAGERCKKGDEEGNPVQVKRQHVRPGQREKVDRLRFVLRVNRQGELGRSVILERQRLDPVGGCHPRV